MSERLYGYVDGEVIEYKPNDDHPWTLATIVQLDFEDPDLPFRVERNENGGSMWVALSQVRKVGATSGRLQYRLGFDWHDVAPVNDDGASYRLTINRRTVDLRFKIDRSDEEILAELRKRDSEGRLIPAEVSQVLKGEF